MPTSVRLSWQDPSGKSTGVEIAIRVSPDAPFTVLDTVAKGVQELDVPDLEDGTYEFRAVALNGAKRSASGVTAVITLESAPGEVTSFVAVVL